MATTPKNTTDPRVYRTRKMLQAAMIALMQEKTLAAVSIKEITKRAEVSRGTFYAHYTDKYELVEMIIREDFSQAIRLHLAEADWNAANLRALVVEVLKYFKTIYQRHHRSLEFAPILERAIQKELPGIILALLKQYDQRKFNSHVSLEALAETISWTLFGAALAWCHERTGTSLDQTADTVSSIILNGAQPLLSNIP
jgi:AcrR family transcriptional regulator